MTTFPEIDALDAQLLTLLRTHPRIGVLECSRRLNVARGTAQSRLEKLIERGIITGFGPDISPAAIGYNVMAFVTLELRQDNGHYSVSEKLATIPEVLEAHTVSGAGDMLCRIVSLTNSDLQDVIDKVVATDGVIRASSVIALAERIPYRTGPLVEKIGKTAVPEQKQGTAVDIS